MPIAPLMQINYFWSIMSAEVERRHVSVRHAALINARQVIMLPYTGSICKEQS